MRECIATCLSQSSAIVAACTLLGVILPSVITAATSRPRTQGVLAKLLAACDLMSALSHKDAHGTLKMPGKRSQPIVTVTDSAAAG